MFPKKGNNFPKSAANRKSGLNYQSAIAAALKSNSATVIGL